MYHQTVTVINTGTGTGFRYLIIKKIADYPVEPFLGVVKVRQLKPKQKDE
jgi:hypothetical protein